MYSRVYVEITNICNRNCSFCPGTKRETDSMSLEKFSHILGSLQGVTKHLYFHIMGEPLIHPNLRQFIKMAKESGFHPMITTNGTLLASHGHELIQEGVYKINISVHSFEEGTEKMDFLREKEIYVPVLYVPPKRKKCEVYIPNKDDILIDDKVRNCLDWENAGGSSILFDSHLEISEKQKIKTLKDLL